jgi:hypothetical protein
MLSRVIQPVRVPVLRSLTRDIRNGIYEPAEDGGGFNPASLFTGGAQGAWYDPSDMSTLFQDSAGATPVTAVEQPVGRMLDKSGNGNHATQATGSRKPTLSARKNLQLYSEDLSNAAYRKGGITVSASPANTFSNGKAGNLVTNDGSTTHYFDTYPTNYGLATGTMISHSFFIKNVNATMVRVRTSPSGGAADINLSTLAVSGIGGSAVCSVENLGGGELRISMTAPWVDFTYLQISVDGTSASSAQAHITGIQSEYGSAATTYQRVTTATDYDAVGFPMYLKADGVDDGMATGSVDFTATDAMSIFAGLQKLHDAAVGSVVELSASISENNGSFLLSAPETAAAATFGYASKGTVLASVSAGSLASPSTKVITALSDVSADSTRIDVNGVDGTPSSGDQGTGNYGNYPLYLLRRGGASLPFSGNLYQLVILGRTANATETSNTESFIATKTGIQI